MVGLKTGKGRNRIKRCRYAAAALTLCVALSGTAPVLAGEAAAASETAAAGEAAAGETVAAGEAAAAGETAASSETATASDVQDLTGSVGTDTGAAAEGQSAEGKNSTEETDAAAEPQIQTGWQKDEEGKVYYYDENGEKLHGLQKIKGKYYFFTAKNGVQYHGWKKVDGDRYYFKNGLAKKGYAAIGWKKVDGEQYYFRKNGTAVTGYKKIDGKRYYFGKKGVLEKNQIVGNEEDGYRYSGSDGVCAETYAMRAAVDFIVANTKKKWSNEKKLQTCYYKLKKESVYVGYYDKATPENLSDMAYKFLTDLSGDCKRHAAGLTCIAKALGYDTVAVYGKASIGYGRYNGHCWTKIKIDGEWLMCDLSREHWHTGRKLYLFNKSSAPFSYIARQNFTLHVKEGQEYWSEKTA